MKGISLRRAGSAAILAITVTVAVISTEAAGQATASGDLSVPKPRGVSESPVYIHDEAVARYTLYLFVATLLVAGVALGQDHIRAWAFRPKLRASVRTAPPDCVMVPLSNSLTGELLANALYIGIAVENCGNATAKNVEVFANELQRQRADGRWEVVETFPPMNLMWAHIEKAYFPQIAPGMRRRCSVARITDPTQREKIENAPTLEVGRTALWFDLVTKPNHMGHIVSAGTYKLELFVAAENAKPIRHYLTIKVDGKWYADQRQMLSAGVGVTMTEG